MCSSPPGDEGSLASVDVLQRKLTTDKQLCTKCGLPAIIVLRTDDIYCRDCFSVRVTHKFRCEFGKSRLIRDKEPVLVAHSGGRNSCAMVHLIQEGLGKRAQKKLRFIPELVYIDDHIDSSGSVPQDQENFLSTLLTHLKETGLKYYIFTLEQVFDDSLCPVISNCNNETDCDYGDVAVRKLLSVDRSKLKTLMESSRTETSQESLIAFLRMELLVRFAKKMQCEKIMLGDNASCLASRLMSCIVQGRGAQIPCEMGFSDDRYGNVTFVKPMREFTEKEIDMYNAIVGIRAIVIRERGTEIRSLENLSRQFVSGLQAEHESTLAIICRTGEKLEMPGDEVKKMERCVLCQAPNYSTVSSHAASAVGAMTFSHSIHQLLQEKTSSKQDSAETCNIIKAVTRLEAAPEQSVWVGDKLGSNVKNNDERLLSVQLVFGLCYGCKLTVREMVDVRKLPSSIILRAEEKSRSLRTLNPGPYGGVVSEVKPPAGSDAKRLP